ncbi:hypothetical protein HN08_15340 [Listeria monocytogenes]|uniref:Uncharacterized protein n=1 Tax=Listeria monocytogenes TaxID=1639 RepID=A0A9P1XM41_LISMN|nr:hypothetical protein [Listeria monocytogenes]AVV07527.1 hypothetical protein CXL08_11310 [Listeria monocytogenes]EAA0329969.1 hypothetical protein [Listeria monocytogenes]EAC2536153.1 hypothetical protein [Listeria monocytogenes]EAC2669001.1 hypothetical protein [Listeria monocytogenes]EAC2738478.1 hypothetical protein [Listeria monocytogenes]
MNENECYYAANLITFYAGQELIGVKVETQDDLQKLTHCIKDSLTSLAVINERLNEIALENFCKEFGVEYSSQRSGAK